MEDITLKDIVDITQWQKIQDHFAEVIGIHMRTVDLEGNLITTPSNTARLCEEIVRGSPVGMARCGKCLPPSIGDLELYKMWEEGYLCHIGLHNFSIPVIVTNNKTIAYVLVGPILLGERKKTSRYQEKITELGIDLERFIDGLIEIKLFSFSGIQAVVELLYDVTSYIAQLGYHRFKLERIIPLPKVSEMVYKFYIDRLLNALLDVSFNTTDAEFGSIMLLDEKRGELYIKIGRGIKKDIIKQARLKIGEGIAGLAAQEKRSLLLDDKITDERIKSRLQRPEIKSAIVTPLQLKDEIFGVMNLGTSQPSNKFNYENIAILNQLVKLVSITLQDVSTN